MFSDALDLVLEPIFPNMLPTGEIDGVDPGKEGECDQNCILLAGFGHNFSKKASRWEFGCFSRVLAMAWSRSHKNLNEKFIKAQTKRLCFQVSPSPKHDFYWYLRGF